MSIKSLPYFQGDLGERSVIVSYYLSYDTDEFPVIVMTTMMMMMMIRRLAHVQIRRIVLHDSLRSRYVHTPAKLKWEDPLDAASLLTLDEVLIQKTAHAYCQERLLPRVLGTQVQRVKKTMPTELRC